jgi:hypothetical protein
MKYDLFDDINKIKKTYEKSRGICFIKDILFKKKNKKAWVLFISYILLSSIFIISQCRCNNPIFLIMSLVVFLLISSIILCFLNKIIDSHFKDVLGIDKKTNWSYFNLSCLLFFNDLKDTNISDDKIKLIIKQLIFENDINNIFPYKFVALVSGTIILISRVFIRETLDKKPEWTIVILASGFILITIFNVLHFILNIKRFKNDDIIKKLKQYVNCKKYEMVE